MTAITWPTRNQMPRYLQMCLRTTADRSSRNMRSIRLNQQGRGPSIAILQDPGRPRSLLQLPPPGHFTSIHILGSVEATRRRSYSKRHWLTGIRLLQPDQDSMSFRLRLRHRHYGYHNGGPKRQSRPQDDDSSNQAMILCQCSTADSAVGSCPWLNRYETVLADSTTRGAQSRSSVTEHNFVRFITCRQWSGGLNNDSADGRAIGRDRHGKAASTCFSEAQLGRRSLSIVIQGSQAVP
ncbi:hypothetical protein GE09DRAFT_181774 [Coniochaeta sp. 2T2.1]|nr:hypothetical protein GE09DRAFT_181774 [Coniochaeta sp. 2T2.1]